eukprot:TRINITY_DN252_c0_g1_i6.p6 TRINITY_DN252_c0_g1~~TRINITY_DN252_c0_g1_i6.p6  ORF type:complete len:123 (+),score=64.60 TRINITY_DN252_c0_g1_i6:1955-2323(+)
MEIEKIVENNKEDIKKIVYENKDSTSDESLGEENKKNQKKIDRVLKEIQSKKESEDVSSIEFEKKFQVVKKKKKKIKKKKSSPNKDTAKSASPPDYSSMRGNLEEQVPPPLRRVRFKRFPKN